MNNNEYNDGWIKTKYKSKRKRGQRCATKRVKYFLIGIKLYPIWKPKGFRYYPCGRYVEHGQKYCVKCRAVHKKLKEERKAPRKV